MEKVRLDLVVSIIKLASKYKISCALSLGIVFLDWIKEEIQFANVIFLSCLESDFLNPIKSNW